MAKRRVRGSGSWRRVLHDNGFAAVEPEQRGSRIRAWQSLHDWFPTLEIDPSPGDGRVVLDVTFSACWSNPWGFRFSIDEETTTGRLARRLRGMTGPDASDDLDARFRVDTNLPDQFWALASTSDLRRLTNFPPHVSLKTTRAPGPPNLHRLILTASGTVTQADWRRPTPALAQWIGGLWVTFAETLASLPAVLLHTTDPVAHDISRMRDTVAGRIVDGVLLWDGDRVRRDAATALFNNRTERAQRSLVEHAVGDADIYLHALGSFVEARLLKHDPDRAVPMLFLAMAYRSWGDLRAQALVLLDELGAGHEARELEHLFTGEPCNIPTLQNSRYWWACAESLAVFIQWALEHDGAHNDDGPAVSWHDAIRASDILADLAAIEALPWVEELSTRLQNEQNLPIDILNTARLRLTEAAQLPRAAPHKGRKTKLPRPADRTQSRKTQLPRPPED